MKQDFEVAQKTAEKGQQKKKRKKLKTCLKTCCHQEWEGYLTFLVKILQIKFRLNWSQILYHKVIIEMSRLFCMLCCFVFLSSLNAQTTDGMVGYYSFNDSTANDMSGLGSNGIIVGNPSIVCGDNAKLYPLPAET